MRLSTQLPLAALLGLCACGSEKPAPRAFPQNAFTGTLTITSAKPAGATNCLTTSTVVILATGVDLHTVSVAGGDCLTFSNGDAAPHSPGQYGTGCPEINAPATLAAGESFTTGVLSGPKTCNWQDRLNPPPVGGGGGGGGGGY